MLTKRGATVPARGMLYKAVAQTVLIYGIDSWVATRAMLKLFEGFHHRATQKIAGMTDRHTEDREWEYPLVVDALEAAGIWSIKEYIQRQKATISAQVGYLPIYELCNGSKHMTGSSRLIRWWYQDMVRKEEYPGVKFSLNLIV